MSNYGPMHSRHGHVIGNLPKHHYYTRKKQCLLLNYETCIVNNKYQYRDFSERNRGEVPSVSCVEDVLEVIKDDYREAYFLTGIGFLC